MQNRQVDRWVAWVNENRPHVTLLGEAEVRRIVIRAIDDSSAVRFWLVICGAFAGAFLTYHVTMRSADPSFNRWYGGIVVAGFAALLTLITGKFTDALIVRKIESLASGNRHQ